MDLCASSDHTCAVFINGLKNAEVLGPFCLGVPCQTDLQKDTVDLGFISRIKNKLTQVPCWERAELVQRATLQFLPMISCPVFAVNIGKHFWSCFIAQ